MLSVCAFLLTLPLDQQPVISFLSISDTLIIVASIFLLVDYYETREIHQTRTSIYITLLYTIIIVGRVPPLLFTNTGLNHVKFIFTGILILLLHIILTHFIYSEDRLRRAIQIIIVSAIFINIVNLLQGLGIFILPEELSRIIRSRSVFGFSLPVEHRAVAFQTTFGIFGVWSIIALSFLLNDITYEHLFSRRVNAISSTIILLSTILVLQSRNVWLGVMVTSFVWVIFLMYRHGWFSSIYPKVIAIASVFLLVVNLPNLYSSLVSVNRYTFESRINQYTIALSLFERHPLTGVGRGRLIETVGEALHSLYLQLLVFNGAIGLFAFLIIAVLVYRSLFSLSLQSSRPLSVGFISAISGVLLVVATYPAASTYSFWMIFSLASVYISISGAESPIEKSRKSNTDRREMT